MSDGTFTYTPYTDFAGTDTFVYTASDGYGGTDTGTVTVTVANTPAPVGTSDSYTAEYEVYVEAAAGVLANDTNPNSGTLTAVLASGPMNGTLQLGSDGSFRYIPNAGFVGTDSFTYRPTDADGPGTPTTVNLTITDHPPFAANDTATTTMNGTAIISVLTNDMDMDYDPLTVIGASDGIYGTTVVNTNGTITYTPQAGWYGTDQFVYVIDDGHGRLAYATVIVTVTAPPVSISGSIFLDANQDGLQPGDALDTAPIMVYLYDGNGNFITSTFAMNGTYSFTGLPPGQYQVRVMVPPNRTVASQDAGTNDAVDYDFDAQGHSAVFALVPGTDLDLDIGWL